MEGASRNDQSKHEFNIKSGSSNNNFPAAYSSGGAAKKTGAIKVSVKKKA